MVSAAARVLHEPPHRALFSPLTSKQPVSERNAVALSDRQILSEALN
jgi:hypothetical protein